LTSISHTQAVTLLLNGYSISEIAEMFEVSRTTIYNRRKDFLDFAQKEGLLMAVEHFEVEKSFETMINLAREFKQNNLTIDDARKGSEIAILLDSIVVEDPESFIKNVIQKAQESNISGTEITNYAVELRQLEEQESKSYTKLVSEINHKLVEHNEIEDDLVNLKSQLENVNEELVTALDESNTTKEKLEIYTSSQSSLIDKGIDVNDIASLDNLVTNLKEHDFNADEAIKFFSSTHFTKDDYERNVKESKRLEIRNNALLKENEDLDEKLNKNLAMTSTVRNLIEANINPEEILEIFKTVTGMMEMLELSEGEALNRFIIDIKTQYNEKNGYVFELEEIKNIHKAYQKKNSMLREQLEVLEEVVDDRKNAIESLKRLNTLEIEDAEIVEWGTILQELGHDVSSFRAMFSTLGGIPGILKEKTANISELEAKEEQLQNNVNDLNVQLVAMQETINLLRETVEVEALKITQAVEVFEEYFTSPETGFKVRSIRIVDDIAENLTMILDNTQNKWGSDLEILEDYVSKTVEETNRILANAYTGGSLVGRFHALEPIHKILREDTVSSTEGIISVITMLAYIKIWLKANYSEELADEFDRVIEKLTGDLGNIY
jgi:predicted DNA-binding protein YlxM (UPF0122 family)